MTYADTEVKYDLLDEFKCEASRLALQTVGNSARWGFDELTMSRGESAHLLRAAGPFVGHLIEGLGTKCLVADAMYRLTGKSYDDVIAHDTVAAIVNDMITLGVMPVAVDMFLAAGDLRWFRKEARWRNFLKGWQRACEIVGCSWGMGETQVLEGVVMPGRMVFAGSAVGVALREQWRIRGDIKDKDVIILLESSGIHANGLSLARRIIERQESWWEKLARGFFPWSMANIELPESYLTLLSGEKTVGEALLEPTRIYVSVIRECLMRSLAIHYAVHITGHGWLKLMRHPESFLYVIEKIPEPQSIFSFLQECGPVDEREMYRTFNMGAGFALIVSEHTVDMIETIAAEHGISSLVAGRVQKRGKEKKLFILPKNLEFDGKELQIRR